MDKQVTDIMKKSDEKYLKVKQRKELLDYKAIFALFVKQRNITLIRFLLTKQEFQRKWFIVALEEEAYDMAALLHKEFFRTILTNAPSPSKAGAANKNAPKSTKIDVDVVG
jgi:hypothetical protein